jgi:hypothetical protein
MIWQMVDGCRRGTLFHQFDDLAHPRSGIDDFHMQDRMRFLDRKGGLFGGFICFERPGDGIDAPAAWLDLLVRAQALPRQSLRHLSYVVALPCKNLSLADPRIIRRREPDRLHCWGMGPDIPHPKPSINWINGN